MLGAQSGLPVSDSKTARREGGDASLCYQRIQESLMSSPVAHNPAKAFRPRCGTVCHVRKRP